MAADTTDKLSLHGGVTLRAVLVALVIVAFLSILNPYNDEYRHNTLLAGNHFPIAPFFALFLLTIVGNGLLGLVSWLVGRDWKFRSAELLIIWLLTVVASGIPSSGLNRYLTPVVYAPFYHKTPENDWESKLCLRIHDQLVPSTNERGVDREAILAYHEGIRGGRDMTWGELVRKMPWGSLWRPFVFWTILVLAIYLVMFSVCALLARQWTERENLQFPLLQLPHELVEKPQPGKVASRFLLSHAAWVGAALPICIHLLNGLRIHYPKLPQFPTFFNIDASLVEPFWRHFRPMNIFIWFSFIGVAFLLNKKVSLSFWFFFIFMRLQFAILDSLGYLRQPADVSPLFWNAQAGRVPEQRQVFGAQFMWFLFILWLARKALWRGAKRAFIPRSAGKGGWYTPDFWAWTGLALGVTVTLGWCWTYGVSLWAAAGYLAVFMVTATIATRLICQAGLIFVQFNYTPVEPLFSTGFTLGGATAFSPTSVVMLSVVNRVFAMDIRELLMPSVMQGAKLGSDLRTKRWKLYGAMGLAILVALPLSFFAFQAVVYRYGGIDIGWWTFNSQTGYFYSRVDRALTTGVDPVWWEIFYIGAGMALMAALLLLHRRFVWWPIHPAGYCTANSWAMYNMWFPFFVGWLAKTLVLRYGGTDSYQKWRDFFLGLIFGDMIMGGLWAIINFFIAEAGQRYNVLPL